ncbi:MAG: NAD(P)H-binding protein [Actinomycetota bacterium]|nr:NAD(P)H-binding protein [Actinomycetota bacterium]
MSKLVVYGATGYAGSRIVAEAASRGHEVTAVARNIADAPAIEGVAYVAGSFYDAALLHELTKDADVLVSAIHAMSADGDSIIDALPTLVEVAQTNGVRIGIVAGAGSLYVSAGGEQVRIAYASALPAEAMPEINTHAAFLEALRTTPADVDWFFVSPALSFGSHVPGVRTGNYRLGGDVLLTDVDGQSAISGDDYAIAFVDEIEKPVHHRTRFTVAY